MDKQTEFLFDISKEIKHFYETPVIYLTKNDYADSLFNAMCAIRSDLRSEDTTKMEKIIDTIVDFHLKWLHAVNEIYNFKKRVDDIARDEIYESISYTIDALTARLKYFKKYMEKNRPPLSNSEQAYLNAEVEIVEDMHKDVTHVLLEKLKCFRNFVGEHEFKVKVEDAVDELLNWLDKIYDSISNQVSKYVSINLPHLSSDLTKTLKEIVDELQMSKTPSAIKMIEDLKEKGKELSSMIRCTTAHNLEISKVLEKIDSLNDRIRRLESEPTSAAVMALTHKKEYLERRLDSLERLKITIKSLHNLTDTQLEDVPEEELCVCPDFFRFRIFNHALPLEERERLITHLCYLWDSAIFGEREGRKSMISILSVADITEEFADYLGTYYIDEHSRKIYKMSDTDILYQPNELNELVPVADDEDHIYFYDECGRYFIDPKTRQRVYKAHRNASEYMMDATGVLLKYKEERDGVMYYYDNYGRYCINAEGKHVYREEDSVSEYENDGLGNLVRIRSHPDIFKLCPGDANVTEDFKYLKQSVGKAIQVSIADCILHQPADPIKFLSARLIKFKENMQIKELRATEQAYLNTERERILAEERAAAEKAALEAALLAQGGSEASFDSNLLKYTSMNPDGSTAVVSPQ